ncbi:MAG TPA: S-layer protein domain-containing protein [Methanotrichaceae archaeon]|nr:S-layer protein domain-containing protein [Methanotrichaceae archaeon]
MALAMIFLLSLMLPMVHAQVSEVAMVRGHSSSGNGTWGPEDFGWFYYDLDEGLGGEMLSVDVDGKVAEEGNIIYSSRVFSSDFEYDPWGSYDSIAFLGKLYLAGYPDSSFVEAESSLEKGALREVLIDNDEVHTLTYSDNLPLLDGYTLVVKQISESNEEIDFVLLKNRVSVDEKLVSVGDTYVFKKDDIPIILVQVADAMCGENCGIVEVDGVFQVSDDPVIQLVEGGRLDNMKLTDLSEDGIEFRTNKDLNLKKDSVVPLLDGLLLVVLDAPELVYYPQGAILDYGVHEIRGPVYNESSALPVYNPATGEMVRQVKARWNFENFSGFYFDPEDNLGRETLNIENLSGRYITPVELKIENRALRGVDGGMQYTSFVQPAEFKFEPWGYYNVISLFGQQWFAGYGSNTSSEIDRVNTMNQQQISQMLLDLGDSIPVSVGESLPLQDGYDLRLLSVSEDKAFIHLRKNGEMVNSAVLTPNSTYTYEKDVGEVDDLPIIAVYVQNVFNSTREKGMIIDGVFQVSDRYYLPVESGEEFGEFKIIVTTPGFIFMGNPDVIGLDRDSSQGLWSGTGIRVADNDTLRYYLYTNKYVVPKPELREEWIDYPEEIPSSSWANFTMLVKAGDIRRVNAEIINPDGWIVYSRDITEQKMGSGDSWVFSWRWNATTLMLSDNGSYLMDADQPLPALLYVNQSSQPVKVDILFGSSGSIASITDGSTSYYLSPLGLSLVNANLSYEDMLQNATARKEYIKIEPGRSMLRFFDFLKGTTSLNSTNHTITGPIESLEPHALRTGAEQGSYELRLRVENPTDALRVGELFFNVTEPEVRGVVLGSSNALSGEAVSIPLKVPRSGGEKSINISYDPAVVEATGVTGPCDVPSYIDPAGGRISVVMPANCSSTNLTFNVLDLAKEVNATTKLQVVDVKGFQPEVITNGSITVIPANTVETEKSSAPAFVVALAVFALMAFAWRRRTG